MIRVGDKIITLVPFRNLPVGSEGIITELNGSTGFRFKPDPNNLIWHPISKHFKHIPASKLKKLGAAAKIAADRVAAHRKAVEEAGLDWAFKQKRADFIHSARAAVMGEAITRAGVVDRKLGLRK